MTTRSIVLIILAVAIIAGAWFLYQNSEQGSTPAATTEAPAPAAPPAETPEEPAQTQQLAP